MADKISPGGMGYLSIVLESSSNIGGMVGAVRWVWMIFRIWHLTDYDQVVPDILQNLTFPQKSVKI